MALSIDERIRMLFAEWQGDWDPRPPNVSWLLRDLRKLIPARGPADAVAEHPNLLASQCLLTAVDFLGRFYNHKLPSEIRWKSSPPPRILAYTNKQARAFSSQHMGGRTLGDSAIEFLESPCFPDAYREPLYVRRSGRVTKTTKAKAVWKAFRHGHVHGYVQKRLKLDSGGIILGQASWEGRRHLEVWWSRAHGVNVFQLGVRPLHRELVNAVTKLQRLLGDRKERELRRRFAVAFDLWRRPDRID